ncbi:TlpA disulfide reductase family protein [uncultured Dokdonia sp.]|uniref:TlpA disulfide reductase family protein n=1 Tax=uncultured Dokdonia sp. TaxID=575653 RepID=UPI0026381108|nr:TlpA disulfide reductase family protein [uncultured Dokdonia sp.]
MKSMYSILFLFSLLLLNVSCEEEKQVFEITAQLDGFTENAVVTLIDGVSSKEIATTQIKNRAFVFSGYLSNTPTSLNILIKEDDHNTSITSLFIANEKINIQGDKKDFPDNLQILGSPHQALKTELAQKTTALNDSYDEEIQKMIAKRQANMWNDSLQTVYWGKNGVFETIDNEILAIKKEFIEENINTYYGLKVLASTKNNLSKAFITSQLQQLQPTYKETEYVHVIETFLNNEPLAKNDFLYDFEAENQEGQIVQFSDHFDSKKYVLLEFSSPHCGWCKKALPEIKKLANQKSTTLTIVTLNVENDKDDWIKTSKENKVNWTSLWNEKGRNSDAFTKYRVAGTPTYVLFNQEGKMIKKWTGYDENLIQDIEAHFTL